MRDDGRCLCADIAPRVEGPCPAEVHRCNWCGRGAFPNPGDFCPRCRDEWLADLNPQPDSYLDSVTFEVLATAAAALEPVLVLLHAACQGEGGPQPGPAGSGDLSTG